MEWISSEQTGESALLSQISISTITTTKKFNCKLIVHLREVQLLIGTS